MIVFIAGAREIKGLKALAIDKLNNIIKNGYDIVVGDAEGVDKSVQLYLNSKNYEKVKVYSMEKVRNNIGKWENIQVLSKVNKRTRDYFTEKDKKMAEIADVGFMIWNKKSEGTLNNIINLLVMKKKVCLFIDEDEKIYIIKNLEELENFIKRAKISGVIEKYFELLKRARKNYLNNYSLF